MAYAYAPSLNEGATDDELALGRDHAARAARLSDSDTPRSHQLLVAAIAEAFSGDPAHFAGTMRKACEEIDVANGRGPGPSVTCKALLAEALLKQTPWNYYTSPIDKGGEGGRLIKSTMDHRSLVPTAAEAKGLLGGVLAGNTKHPLGLHLWVVSEKDTTNNTRRRLD